MAKERLSTSQDVQDQASAPVKKPRFRDTWQGFVVFVGVLLVLRFLVFEPFKIPTGSMEPTLIGHEDYGDRIVTNKLAYRGGTNPVGFLGGEPKRFDVFVFVHDNAWQQRNPDNIKITNSLKRNYIKRCVGLPGETIIISGGDLFLLKEGKETILRKWESSTSLQESLWQPVSVPRLSSVVAPPDADAAQRLVCRQKDNRAFPWDVEGAGNVERPEEKRAAVLSGPVALTYRYPVTNVYAKLGRWPFTHEGCPAAHLPGSKVEGVTFSNPKAKSERIAPYMANYWSGVECPNCGQVRFPLVRERDLVPQPQEKEFGAPPIYPNIDWDDIDRNAPTAARPSRASRALTGERGTSAQPSGLARSSRVVSSPAIAAVLSGKRVSAFIGANR